MPNGPVSGQVVRRRGARGDVWYARYRLPDGRQIKQKIGPAWTQRGRPAAGCHTKHTARVWLENVIAGSRCSRPRRSTPSSGGRTQSRTRRSSSPRHSRARVRSVRSRPIIRADVLALVSKAGVINPRRGRDAQRVRAWRRPASERPQIEQTAGAL